MPGISVNRVIGLVCLAGAALLIFVWIPLDVETGVVEVSRRRLVVGDGLAPMVAGAFVALAGALLLLTGRRGGDDGRLSRANLVFIAAMTLCLGVSFLVMRHAGPLAAALFAEGGDYRPLRDTAPWKHVGFLLGGSLAIGAMISFIEGRASWRAALIGLLAALAMIAVYDLPFDDLLLPPNGDV